MTLRRLISLALLTGVASLAVFAMVERDGSPEARVVHGTSHARWPNQTLSDWVGFADHVAVARVAGESRLPLRAAVTQVGEGYVGRTITLDVESTLWSREGAAAAPTSAEVMTDGWWYDEGNFVPYSDVGSHRPAVNDRLVVGLLRTKDHGWALLTTGIPVTDSRVTPDAGQDGVARALDGANLDEAAGLFAAARPAPAARRNAHLDPDARALAVWEAMTGSASRR